MRAALAFSVLPVLVLLVATGEMRETALTLLLAVQDRLWSSQVEQPLNTFCRVLLEQQRVRFLNSSSSAMVIDRAFDLSHVFAAVDANATQWEDLCELKRRHLASAPYSHSLWSSKVELYRLLRTTRLPMCPLLLATLAHEYAPANFSSLCRLLQSNAIDPAWSPGLVVKPSHCVKSAGFVHLAVEAAATHGCDAVRTALEGAWTLRPDPVASHMAGLEPGAVVQRAFDDPGQRARHASAWWPRWTDVPRPFELKCLVVWFETLVCNTQFVPGVKYVFPDGTGSGTNTDLMQWLHAVHVPTLVRVAEAMARALGSPTVRVDFFVARDARAPLQWAVNELELVTGIGFHDVHVQPCMAALWRQGYTLGAFRSVERSNAQRAAAMREVDPAG